MLIVQATKVTLSHLMIGPNKIECLSLGSLSSLVLQNNLAYWLGHNLLVGLRMFEPELERFLEKNNETVFLKKNHQTIS